MTRHAGRRAGRAAWLLASGLCLLQAGTAAANSFSFGSIAATDVIDNLVIGAAGPTLEYDQTTGWLRLESFITTINFHNRAPLAIPAGTVTIVSEVQLTGATFLPLPFAVQQVTAQFTNGLVDFQIIDTVGTGGGPILLLEGDFAGSSQLSAQVITSVIVGDYSGDLADASLAGDADFRAAFGTSGGNFAVNPAFGLPSGGTLCGVVVNCGAVATLKTFDVAANGEIQSYNPIPEPGTALLVGTGLLGLCVRRRR